MKTRTFGFGRIVTLLCLVGLAGTSTFAQALDELGHIEFENTGSEAAQESFLRGVLLLHSFEYKDSAEAFREAQEIEPEFALAYWGEALTHWHPIWHEDDRDQAQAVLARLAPSAEERRALAGDEREAQLMDAIEILYGEGHRPERSRAYSEAMGRLHGRYPADHEIAAFYSVSILGTVEQGRDIPVYMRAAAIAEDIYEANPLHPGALHYAIHSYDDPEHAPLGLRMARRYAEIAPAAQHALHMPSHIFVALGMWAEASASNEDSSHAADLRRERKGLPLAARGYHSLYWLLYSYMQQGRLREARALLDDMVRDEADADSQRTRYHLVRMRAAYAVDAPHETGVEREIDVSNEGLSLGYVAADHFALGAHAVRAGELDEAHRHLDEMRRKRTAILSGKLEADEVPSCCSTGTPAAFLVMTPAHQAALVMESELEGLVTLAEGDEGLGLELLRLASEDEARMDYNFGPPMVVKPSHELLGEELLRRDQPAEAARAFRTSLQRAPRRTRSLLGLARAQVALGDREATETYAELASILGVADEDYPLLDEVRAAGL